MWTVLLLSKDLEKIIHTCSEIQQLQKEKSEILKLVYVWSWNLYIIVWSHDTESLSCLLILFAFQKAPSVECRGLQILHVMEGLVFVLVVEVTVATWFSTNMEHFWHYIIRHFTEIFIIVCAPSLIQEIFPAWCNCGCLPCNLSKINEGVVSDDSYDFSEQNIE